MTTTLHLCPPPQRQRGMSLIVVLLLLVIVSMLGAASMQIANMGEHGARNDRDMQLAFQSAEAAIIDAEIDIGGETVEGGRTKLFKAGKISFPSSGCKAGGLCALETNEKKKPTWLNAEHVNFVNGTGTASFGDFTNRDYQNAGGTSAGVQPVQKPRYIIENVTDLSAVRSGMVTAVYSSALPEDQTATGEQLYRVTAMGFGPRSSTQSVLQTLYRN